MSTWKKINPEVDDIPFSPFLLMDKSGYVYVSSTAFDFYDSEFWCDMPTFPGGIITNDDCLKSLIKKN
jgi:hypothetical protein